MMHINAKATLTNDTDYSCHIKGCRTCLTNCVESISCHIMSLVVNSIKDGHTDTYTLHKILISKNQVRAFGQHTPSLITTGIDLQ